MLNKRIIFGSQLLVILMIAGAILFSPNSGAALPHAGGVDHALLVQLDPTHDQLPCEMPGITKVKFLRNAGADTTKRYLSPTSPGRPMWLTSLASRTFPVQNWPLGPPNRYEQHEDINHLLCRLRL